MLKFFQRLPTHVEVEPGIFTIDFELPPELEGAGDQPIVITVLSGATIFQGRLDSDAPLVRIL